MGRAKGLREVTTEDREAASALTFRVLGSPLGRMGRKIEVVVHPATDLEGCQGSGRILLVVHRPQVELADRGG